MIGLGLPEICRGADGLPSGGLLDFFRVAGLVQLADKRRKRSSVDYPAGSEQGQQPASST